MKKITGYKLLQGYHADIVIWANELISEGWQPLGSAQPCGYSALFIQTMVKYHPTDNV